MADVIFASGAAFLMVCGGLAILYATKTYWARELLDRKRHYGHEVPK